MSPKIHAQFWTDPDLEDVGPEVKLVLLWMMTNPEINFVGVFTVTPKRFAFETGLEAHWLEEALIQKPKMFVRVGERVLIKNFIKHQFGTGEKLRRNNMGRGLMLEIPKLPAAIQEEVYALYPELKPFEGLGSPSQALQSPLPLHPHAKGYGSPSKGLASPSPNNNGAGLEGVESSAGEEFSSGSGKPFHSPSKDIGIRNKELGIGKGETGEGNFGMRFDLAQKLLEFLNKKTGATFHGSHASLTEIALRLIEVNGDVAGIEAMIERQVLLWGADKKMREYLRPGTLFHGEKFHDYYGKRALPAEAQGFEDQAEGLRLKIEKSRANSESSWHSQEASAQERADLKKWRGELAALSKKLSGPNVRTREEAA